MAGTTNKVTLQSDLLYSNLSRLCFISFTITSLIVLSHNHQVIIVNLLTMWKKMRLFWTKTTFFMLYVMT